MGSFYSSIVSTCLVKGVGKQLPKVYAPNFLFPTREFDPEIPGLIFRTGQHFASGILEARVIPVPK